MDHWRLAYLGLRHFPHELTEFELHTFSRSPIASAR